METKQAAGVFVNQSGGRAKPRTPARVSEQPAPAQRKTVTAKPTSKARKIARQPSRAASRPERLVCRYCGSDDLAPSFKKRRDARCRACFKKRYGAAARGKKAKRAGKAKSAR